MVGFDVLILLQKKSQHFNGQTESGRWEVIGGLIFLMPSLAS